MKIKLVKKEISVDKETFQPILRVTVDVPMERVIDEEALEGQDVAYLKIGRAFVDAVVSDGKSFLDGISGLLTKSD